MATQEIVRDDRSEVLLLRARLRAEEKKLSLVQEIGKALSSGRELDALLGLIMEKITVLMEADRATLFLHDAERGELWSKVLQGGELREIRLRVGEGIAGWVASSGETVNIPDAYSDVRFQPAVDHRSGYRTRTILCLPIRGTEGQVIGVIQVLNKDGGPFTDDDEELLGALASLAAIALENAKLYHSVVAKNVELQRAQRALEQKTHELNILYEIEQEMNAALDLDELLERLLRRALDVVGARAGSIALRDTGHGDLLFRTALGELGDSIKRLRLPVGQGIVGWVTAHKTPVIVNEPAADERHDDELAEALGHRPRNLLCAPLVAETEVLGAIEVLDKVDDRGFDEGDLKLLVLIAGQTSKAIQLARAKEDHLNQSRLASIGQMLSGVLHDLKTPMTIVSGYAQLMAQIEDAAQREEYVELILKQFELMGSMTREVLQFARGETSVLLRKVFLHRYLDEVAAHLRYEFAGKGIELVLDTGYRGVAYFDEQKMLRVIHNIARNAAQAMPGGGTFRLATHADNARVTFEFSDTGGGIPAEMEGRLFEAFATAGKKDGTGLGLAIVKKIVDEHGGSIGYRSARGQGTTFTVSIPLQRPASLGATGEVRALTG